MRSPNCRKCGSRLTTSPTGKSMWCTPCARLYAKNSRRLSNPNAAPVSVAGARERLAATLASMPVDYLLERIADLLHRGGTFGMTMRTAAEVDAARGELA